MPLGSRCVPVMSAPMKLPMIRWSRHWAPASDRPAEPLPEMTCGAVGVPRTRCPAQAPMAMPDKRFGQATRPLVLVPIRFPATRLLVPPSNRIPMSVFEEMTLRSVSANPPITLLLPPDT